MNIILIGFMGSGKTTIGRKLAVRLGYRFVDTDRQIQREQDCKVSEIFAQNGESYFRALEIDLLKRLQKVHNTVIATGGGILTASCNLDLIRKLGTSVYLKASIEEICERVSRNNKRPLLQTNNQEQTVSQLMESWNNLYLKADFTINTESLRMSFIVSQIIREL